MNVLLAASECVPFVKTGGLADVVSALTKALAGLGVSPRVLLPAYAPLRGLAASGDEAATFHDDRFGHLRVVFVEAEGIPLFLLDAPHLFERPGGPYTGPDGRDWHDNHVRFAALAKVAARIGIHGAGGWRPDVLHLHDWQAALAPAYLRAEGARVPTVTTVHNMAFQGVFWAGEIHPLGLSPGDFTIDGFEYHGHISFLKAGLVWSDRITTVSPTYARELLSPEFGMGLEGVLRARQSRLSGILNGVDLDVWNPATDAALPAPYGPDTAQRRSANREALLARFSLDLAPDAPLFCVISRLTWQKGMDVLLEALPRLVARGAGLALLGAGEPHLEGGFRAASEAHPRQIGVRIGYDETLSHLLQGGADAILIPSRFEPCGLTQLYGLRYGCLPVVARTGGLADTVIDANDAAAVAGVATGFQFAPVSPQALGDALDRVCDTFADRDAWAAMMRNAMRHPVGWDRSAAAYRDLYRDVLPSAG